MTNTIHSPITGLDLPHVDSLLPFENRHVWIWHVTYKEIEPGKMWRIVLDMEIDGRRKVLSFENHNTSVIRTWDDFGRIGAVYLALWMNDDTLKEFISKQETEELKHFNIE